MCQSTTMFLEIHTVNIRLAHVEPFGEYLFVVFSDHSRSRVLITRCRLEIQWQTVNERALNYGMLIHCPL